MTVIAVTLCLFFKSLPMSVVLWLHAASPDDELAAQASDAPSAVSAVGSPAGDTDSEAAHASAEGNPIAPVWAAPLPEAPGRQIRADEGVFAAALRRFWYTIRSNELDNMNADVFTLARLLCLEDDVEDKRLNHWFPCVLVIGHLVIVILTGVVQVLQRSITDCLDKPCNTLPAFLGTNFGIHESLFQVRAHTKHLLPCWNAHASPHACRGALLAQLSLAVTVGVYYCSMSIW